MSNPFVGVAFDIQTPEELQTRFYEHIQAAFPDWEPREPSLEVTQAEIFCQMLFELMTMASDVPPSHFEWFGRLIQIPPESAIAATVQVTFTSLDTVGHTIPADTLIAWNPGEDTGLGFYTPAEYSIPAGLNSVTVPMICEVEGTIGNGFSGSSIDVDGPQLVSQLDFIDSITAVAPTDGGFDQEPITDYLNRLTSRLKLLRDGVVRADDASLYVVTVVDGIGRALCFDNYKGDTGTPNVEKSITIVGHDLDGADLTTDKINELLALLARRREVNFNFYYRHPDRHDIGVTASISVEPDSDPAAIALNVAESLVSAFDPLVWGQPSSAQGPTWLNTSELQVGWIYSRIDRVEGVRRIVGDITYTVDGVSHVGEDTILSGLAPLTQIDASNIHITVVP
jgi:hypothetical protein